MKTVKKMALLLVAVASNSASAQNKVVLAVGTTYTITSAAEVSSSGGTVLYQWYRNGSKVEGAAGLSYTVPSEEAVGSNVKFQRAAYLEGCEERKFSNPFTITWCNLKVGETCWADENVAQPGTFAPRPDMYTEFYQWNQPNKAWPATGSISGTWLTNIAAPAWTSTPCPEGWRLPTYAECQALHEAGGELADNVGGTWAASTAGKGNAVNGRYYGPNHATCALTGSMVGCIFLPAVGWRNEAGELNNQSFQGFYWSSTAAGGATGRRLWFSSAGSNVFGSIEATGNTVRCVQ